MELPDFGKCSHCLTGILYLVAQTEEAVQLLCHACGHGETRPAQAEQPTPEPPQE